MVKYSGLVGYGTQLETYPGVWETQEKITSMKGDLISQNVNINAGASINDDITLQHRVSLIGDPYSFDNYYNLKWIEIHGRKWSISSIQVQRPRLIVSLGGLWNGE